MDAFTSMTKLPDIQFKTRAVNPPPQLYINPDDSLWFLVRCSRASVTLQIFYRVLLPDGKISSNRYDVAVTSDRTGNNVFIKVPEGFLLGIIIRVAGGPRRGQIYVQGVLSRGDTFAQSSHSALLMQGYLSFDAPLGWPYMRSDNELSGCGWLRSVTGTDPAANTEISEVVPNFASWRVLGVRFTLVTDATAANRLVRLVLDDGTSKQFELEAPAVQAASLTRNYQFGVGLPSRTLVTDTMLMPLPEGIIFPGACRIRTITDNLQATDNYSAPQLTVEEFLQI